MRQTTRRYFLMGTAGLLLPAYLAGSRKAGAAALVIQGSGRYIPPESEPTLTFVPESADWSMTGTPGNGSRVTLTYAPGGLGFPADCRYKHVYQLEGNLNSDTTYSRVTRNLSAQSGTAWDAAVHPPGRTQSFRQSLPVAGNSALWFSTDPAFQVTGGACVRRFKRRWDYFWNEMPDPVLDSWINMKIDRIWDSVFAHDILYADTNVHRSNVEQIWDGSDGSIVINGTPDAGGNMWAKDTWTTDAVLFVDSTLNTFDGIWNVIRNGRLVHADTSRWLTRNTSFPGSLTEFYNDQYSNSDNIPNLPGHFAWVGGIMVFDDGANAHKEVIVSDETSWSTATGPSALQYTREPQLKLNGSDNSIEFDMNQGDHASFDGKRVYVKTGPYTILRAGRFELV